MLALLLFLAAAPLQNIEVHGLKAATPKDVSALSGLTMGQRADKPDFDKACSRILASGFFTSCNYKFSSAQKGYTLAFDLEEAERTQTVRLEIPGLNRKQWETSEPMLAGQIPSSDQAIQTYVAALQRFLKTSEIPNVDIDMQHKETVIALGDGKKVARRSPETTAPEAAVAMVLGEVTFKGLPTFTERRVRALWTLKAGEPVDETTADLFVTKAFDAKVVPVEFQDASTNTNRRPNSNIADITITFKNGTNSR